MRWLLLLLAALPVQAQEVSPEVQLTLTSLRAGERVRLEKAVGRADGLTLYRAELEFDPAARQVKGKVAMSLGPAKRREVRLRLTPNATHPDAVKLKDLKVNGKSAAVEQLEPSLLRVKLAEPSEGPLQLEFALTARVPKAPDDSEQLATGPGALEQRGDYGAFSAAKEVSCLTGVLPMVPPLINGRPADGPSGIGDLGSFAPTNFLVSVTVPRGHAVVAPGNQVGELPDGKGGVRFAFTAAAARDLPILVTKGYEVATTKVGDVTVESHYAAADEKAGKAALEHAARALELLEQRLGPYPWQRLKVVEARLAGGAGGMEFPGLITVSTALYRGAADPLSVLGLGAAGDSAMLKTLVTAMLQPMLANTLELTIDHEVAHQYFAMVVGNDPIEEPIVDEPLTQHAALLLLEWRRGRGVADELRDGQLRMAYQVHRLSGGADGRANRPAREYASNGEYAALMYGKAPLFYDELRKVVGDDAWLKALRAYVDEQRYQWAGPRTLTSLVVRQNPKQAARIEELRRRWWDEKHGDEDLGTLDLDKLLGGLGKGQGGLDPKVLEEYQKAIDALLGGQ